MSVYSDDRPITEALGCTKDYIVISPMTDVYDRPTCPEILRSSYNRILHGLEIANRVLGFVNCDLHGDNVLFTTTEEHAIIYMTDDCVNNNIRIKGYRTHGVRPKIIDYGMSVVHGKIVAYLSYTRRPAYDRRITYQSNVWRRCYWSSFVYVLRRGNNGVPGLSQGIDSRTIGNGAILLDTYGINNPKPQHSKVMDLAVVVVIIQQMKTLCPAW